MNALLDDIAPWSMPLVPLYAAATGVRNWCYDRKFLPSGSVDVPVISVGNITAGGNGKTPATEYIVRHFLCRKARTGVLSRGYRRSTRGTLVVSDGNTLSGSPDTTGDEPYQIARKFPEALVVVDEDRLRGAAVMCDSLHPDVIVLDDGFQHRRLRRNLDIVLIDGRELLEGLHFLPAGRLRESPTSLRRAQAVILLNCGDSLSRAVKIVRQYTDVTCYHAEIEPVNLTRMSTGERISLNNTLKRDCLAFCAIAKPKNFLSTLQSAGFVVREFTSFADHHALTDEEYDHLGKEFRSSGASMVVTTEKDAVRSDSARLSQIFPSGVCYFLEIRLSFRDREGEFQSLLNTTAGVTA